MFMNYIYLIMCMTLFMFMNIFFLKKISTYIS
jgi:hypothetical protein